MAINRLIARALAREHAFRPIHGTALLIGRQTVNLTRAEALSILDEQGVPTAHIDPATLALDTSTKNRQDTGRPELISAAALMSLLGAEKVVALDVSAYEDADIIHDLRFPIPSELAGIADIVVDGSTLDNVFSPSVALQNYAHLLKPGGRLLAVNAFSADTTGYVMLPPLW